MVVLGGGGLFLMSEVPLQGLPLLEGYWQGKGDAIDGARQAAEVAGIVRYRPLVQTGRLDEAQSTG
jgi:hypothetical protein